MRGWERQPGEGTKAFECFKAYRDMGLDRTLRKVAELVYGEKWESNLRTLKRWSAKFDWVSRVQGVEDRDELLKRQTIEEYLERGAADRARREAALVERSLAVREAAMDQAEKMIRWPLSRQEVVREGPDGDEVTMVFSPVGWSKSTAVALFNMAVSNAERTADPGADLEYDFSEWEEHEMAEFLRLHEKLSPRRPEG